MKSHECSTADSRIKAIFGCERTAENGFWFEYNGYKFDRCPGYYVQDGDIFVQQSINFYSWREKGFLPYPGTYLEQPNIVIEAIDFVERLVTEKNESERRTMEIRAKGKNHGR